MVHLYNKSSRIYLWNGYCYPKSDQLLMPILGICHCSVEQSPLISMLFVLLITQSFFILFYRVNTSLTLQDIIFFKMKNYAILLQNIEFEMCIPSTI